MERNSDTCIGLEKGAKRQRGEGEKREVPSPVLHCLTAPGQRPLPQRGDAGSELKGGKKEGSRILRRLILNLRLLAGGEKKETVPSLPFHQGKKRKRKRKGPRAKKMGGGEKGGNCPPCAPFRYLFD